MNAQLKIVENPKSAPVELDENDLGILVIILSQSAGATGTGSMRAIVALEDKLRAALRVVREA